MSLKKLYSENVSGELFKELQLKNPHQIPKLVSITVSLTKNDKKILAIGKEQLEILVAQKPCATKAKKSIAGFKVRKGFPVGFKATLRRNRMWEFLERFMYLTLPNVRDLKAFERKSFDAHGNLNIGIKNLSVFNEIEFDDVEATMGLNINIKTSGNDINHSILLLKALGLPIQ